MKKLVEDSDLGIPYTTALNKAVVKMAQSLLGINKINDLYGKVSDKQGVEFAQAILDQLGVALQSNGERLQQIPAKGPFVVVANHPHGALDGLLLIVLIARIRPDVKFLGNFLLSRIEPLNQFFLAVDPFNSKSKRNIPGIRKAMNHLKGGAPLVVFPAGEVSTFQRGFKKVEDKEWSPSVMKLIRQMNVPVLPVYIEGRNSLKFHFFGKIHPVFRTIRLPLELINKEGQTVAVVVGSPVSSRRIQEMSNVKAMSDFLRANVYCLKMTLTEDAEAGRLKKGESDTGELKSARKSKREAKRQAQHIREIPNVAQPVDKELLAKELQAIEPTRMLTQIGGMCLFCASVDEIPLTIKEIARLRELTFRTVGEGTLQESDSDKYDAYYKHLFIWDRENQAVAGAYRVGFGDTLFEARGFDGFYTYTLFEFSRHMTDILRQTIELGRSFIVPQYQRKTQALLLLWRGILQLLLENPSYRYLMGPVSMSGGYTIAAKWLLIDYIRGHYWNRELAGYVIPRNGIATLGRSAVDPGLIKGISSMEDIDKLIRDVEPSGLGMPVLMKKYLELGGKVIGFNVDPLFNDALDALLVLDIHDIPKEKIELVAREYSEDPEPVYRRFKALENADKTK